MSKFMRAKQGFEDVKRRKNEIRDAKTRKREDIERKRKLYKQKKFEKYKKLTKKSKYGQPNMAARLDLLMEKIEAVVKD